MSYDLAVFEKQKAPAQAKDFLAWYEEQTKWGGDYDYNDIAHASPNLQKFFQQVRTVFPPMNGPFSPSDEELAAKPALEDRLCDYCIGEDLIYLSLAYSVADSAYHFVKRAAYFAGVGFFAASDDAEAPVYFESRCPMLLEGAWFPPVRVSDFASVLEKLGEMTDTKHSYCYLTDQVGNYIQVGGLGDAFTVEQRVYTDCTSYTHLKAGYVSAKKKDVDAYVEIAGRRIRVKQNEVLPGRTVQQLFLDFFEGTKTADMVEWTDMEL